MHALTSTGSRAVTACAAHLGTQPRKGSQGASLLPAERVCQRPPAWVLSAVRRIAQGLAGACVQRESLHKRQAQ